MLATSGDLTSASLESDGWSLRPRDPTVLTSSLGPKVTADTDGELDSRSPPATYGYGCFYMSSIDFLIYISCFFLFSAINGSTSMVPPLKMSLSFFWFFLRISELALVLLRCRWIKSWLLNSFLEILLRTSLFLYSNELLPMGFIVELCEFSFVLMYDDCYWGSNC